MKYQLSNDSFCGLLSQSFWLSVSKQTQHEVMVYTLCTSLHNIFVTHPVERNLTLTKLHLVEYSLWLSLFPFWLFWDTKQEEHVFQVCLHVHQAQLSLPAELKEVSVLPNYFNPLRPRTTFCGDIQINFSLHLVIIKSFVNIFFFYHFILILPFQVKIRYFPKLNSLIMQIFIKLRVKSKVVISTQGKTKK